MLAFALIRAYDYQSLVDKLDVVTEKEFAFMSLSPFIILNWVAISTSAILLVADIYLISYHTFLIGKNTTTSRYIREKQKISKKKSSIIRELDRKQDDNGSVLDSEANANSIMDSV